MGCVSSAQNRYETNQDIYPILTNAGHGLLAGAQGLDFATSNNDAITVTCVSHVPTLTWLANDVLHCQWLTQLLLLATCRTLLL